MDDEDTFTSVTWESADDAAAASANNAQPSSSKAAASTSSAAAGGSSSSYSAATQPTRSDGSNLAPFSRNNDDGNTSTRPRWEGFLKVQVTEPRKELEGTKDMFVSYGIRAETNLPHFHRSRLTTRRRFQDFVFLRENLAKDFPACVVAPLPDKHRLEYFTGDRFSPEFIERRTADLQLFLERIARHPTLQRAQLLRSFLESTEWHVDMHTHTSLTSGLNNASGSAADAQPHGLLDSLQETFLNAFAKVRKPEEKFEVMRERLEKMEEGLGGTERILLRARARHGGPSPFYPPSSQSSSSSHAPSTSRFSASSLWSSTPIPSSTHSYSNASSSRAAYSGGLSSPQLFAPNLALDPQDLASDYEELAASMEGLAYLESGITDPLNRFATTCMEWARLQRNLSQGSTDDVLSHLHAMLSYAGAHRGVLKLRDQKQLDFEELTDYLNSVVTERDRLASLSSPYGAGHGHGGVRGAGISGYLRDRVDSLRGVDEERTRVQRMQRLDGRIKELQDAVTSSHDISVAFSREVERENAIFDMAKERELKELMGAYVDAQVETYSKGMEVWDRLIPTLEKIQIGES